MSSTVGTKTPQTRLQGRRMTARGAGQTDEISKQLVLINISASVVLLSAITFAYFRFHKALVQIPRMISMTDRLTYTIQLQAFSMIPMMISITHVIIARIMTGAINPLTGNELMVEKAARILTNTVEQTIINLFCQIILTTFIPMEYMFVMPFLVFCFVAGRILFLIGYIIHPKFRTYGFLLTFTPTFLVFFINLAYAMNFTRFLPVGNEPNAAKRST